MQKQRKGSQETICCWYCSVASYVLLFATPWIAACQASLSFTISWSLLKLMSIEWKMPSSHLLLQVENPYGFYIPLNATVCIFFK